MTLALVHLAVMTLPGLALTRLLGVDQHRLCLSISLSLSLLVFVLLAARLLDTGVAGLGWLLAAVYGAVALAWLLPRRRPAVEAAAPQPRRAYAIPVLTFAALLAYMLWAGPYTEVPADAWYHMGRISDRLGGLAKGSIGEVFGIESVFYKFAHYWYTIMALEVRWTGGQLHTSLAPLVTANTLLFCAGVYSFSLFLFRDTMREPAALHAVAAASVVFFVAHFGISVFSYVRYYALAPTMPAYLLYLSAAGLLLTFLRRGEGAWLQLSLAALIGVAAAMVHTQEALFIAAMGIAMLIVEVARACRAASPPGWQPPWRAAAARRSTLLLGLFLAVYLVAHGYAYFAYQRNDPLEHGLMADIRHYLPFLRNQYVLMPTLQFYQVITVWGVLVYVLFISGVRRVRWSTFLVAAAVMPLLTVFNPVFTDLFLRFSYPEVLWRMCYMLPLPFLGGYFLVRAARSAASGGLWRRAGAVLTVAALLGLLLPVQTTYFVSPHSRIYTLAPVAASNDHRLWNDLLSFLRSRDRTDVITDQVTGYVVNGVTSQRYRGYKFYGSGAFSVNRAAYEASDFARRPEDLVVVNLRDGGLSATGAQSGHWPADIMHVSRRYSGAFLDFVDRHPGLFEELWSRDRITVYRIRSPGRTGDGAAAG